MNGSIIQILVLAAIAVFLILKLRSVLGTRDGFEKPPLQQPQSPTQRPQFDVIEGGPDRDITDHVDDGSPAADALAQMKRVEPGFSVSEFLSGARGAYEMILMAFENGDLTQVQPFLSDEVLASFQDVISDREAQGLTIDSTFVGISSLLLKHADFDDRSKEAEISIRFVGELTSVVRDASGQVIEGDPNAITRQADQWTFARKMGTGDPNWKLVATGA